jgi:aspartate racemase
MSLTIGILGGMGPEATAYFFELVIRLTRADRDQLHVPVIILSDPRVPPRSEAILAGGESPVPILRSGARTLEKAGAGLIVMPCITAHYFLAEVREAVRVPFIDLLEEAAGDAAGRKPDVRRAGILGSPGTVKSRIVHRAFQARGIEVIDPAPAEQALVDEAVFGPGGVKAAGASDGPRRLLREAAGALIGRGAGAIIAACTEVPLALRQADLSVPFIEPMKAGALAAIRRAGFPVRGDAPEEAGS